MMMKLISPSIRPLNHCCCSLPLPLPRTTIILFLIFILEIRKIPRLLQVLHIPSQGLTNTLHARDGRLLALHPRHAQCGAVAFQDLPYRPEGM